MKTKIVLNLLLLMTGISSCTVFSVHPLYDEASELTDKRLPGTWMSEDSSTFVNIKTMGKGYDLTRWEKEDTLWYEAHYVKIGENFYFDLYPLDKKPYSIDDIMMRNFLPVHSFLKIELTDNKVSALLFDEDKMIDLFRQNRIRLRHEMLDDYVLITASTKDLQKFILKYSADKEVFEEPEIFIKINDQPLK